MDNQTSNFPRLQFDVIEKELGLLKEKYILGEARDPVFEGMVHEFNAFDETIQSIFESVLNVMRSIEGVCDSLEILSDSLMKGSKSQGDAISTSDACRFREIVQSVARTDAPTSTSGRLRRELDFHIVVPLRQHLLNNRNIKSLIDQRKDLLAASVYHQKICEDLKGKFFRPNDFKMLKATEEFTISVEKFTAVDTDVFDWLCIIKEFKGDIIDSILQTLKYLIYDFFAVSSHCLSSSLPPKIKFRPVIEMLPRHLEQHINLEREEEKILEENNDMVKDERNELLADYTVRLVEKMQKDSLVPFSAISSSSSSSSHPQQNSVFQGEVDFLSLSSLMSQGFDESAARRALRECDNDTQKALEWLISRDSSIDDSSNALRDHPLALVVPASEDERESDNHNLNSFVVRLPSTVQRQQRIMKLRTKIQEIKSAKQMNQTVDGNSSDFPSSTSPPVVSQFTDLLNFMDDMRSEDNKETGPLHPSKNKPLLDDLI